MWSTTLNQEHEQFILLVGNEGYGIYHKILGELFGGSKGYYLEINLDKFEKVFVKKFDAKIEKLKEVIETAIDLDIFNRKIYEKYKVLTNRKIQSSWYKYYIRTKELEVDKRIWLLDDQKLRVKKLEEL